MNHPSSRAARGFVRRSFIQKSIPYIVIVDLLLIIIVSILAILVWSRPLGPQLVLHTATPVVAVDSPPIASPTPLPPEIEPICEGPAVMYVLLIGKDTIQENYNSGFADVIRIARLDFIHPSITLLAIPRDLSVRIPGLERHQIIEGRLKTAYAYGYEYDVFGGGTSLLARTLNLNFNTQIDHYVVTNFAAFAAGIDAIGGIDINVPEAVDTIPAGQQHMDGTTALQYARIRQSTRDPGDQARIDRQTQVIAAIQERAFSPDIIPVWPTLVRELQDSVLTDLSPQDIFAITCLSQSLDTGTIHTLKIDDSMYDTRIDAFGHELFDPDYQAIRIYIEAFNAGKFSPD